MVYAIILAGGVGQRMRQSGMPKQFLEVFGKPIIIYTLEKFEKCEQVDQIVIACNASWIDHMKQLLALYHISKATAVIAGGKDRQESVKNGLKWIENQGGTEQDVVLIHDGVRPLVQGATLNENIRCANKYGCAMTVRPVIETVCVTAQETVGFDDIKKRADTYSLTSPQTFRFGILNEIYRRTEDMETPIPILDPAIGYTLMGNDIHIVKETNNNMKITTPEDYYMLKALLELEENKYVFGL